MDFYLMATATAAVCGLLHYFIVTRPSSKKEPDILKTIMWNFCVLIGIDKVKFENFLIEIKKERRK